MKNSKFILMASFATLFFTSCYTNSLVQSAKTLNPLQAAVNVAFESNQSQLQNKVVSLPHFGVRMGVLNGLELQTRSNLSSYVDMGAKFRLAGENSIYQSAVGLNLGVIRVPNTFRTEESENSEILITEKLIYVPVYLSKSIFNFTIFGGSKLGYAIEAKEAYLTANLGLAYKLPNTKHHVFVEGYNIQSPKSLNATFENHNRLGFTIGVSLNAF